MHSLAHKDSPAVQWIKLSDLKLKPHGTMAGAGASGLGTGWYHPRHQVRHSRLSVLSYQGYILSIGNLSKTFNDILVLVEQGIIFSRD